MPNGSCSHPRMVESHHVMVLHRGLVIVCDGEIVLGLDEEVVLERYAHMLI